VREGGGEGGRERVCMRLSVIVSYIYKHTYVQVRQHNSALAHNPVNPPLQRAADYEGLTADVARPRQQRCHGGGPEGAGTFMCI
jgi:hypothetical protein